MDKQNVRPNGTTAKTHDWPDIGSVNVSGVSYIRESHNTACLDHLLSATLRVEVLVLKYKSPLSFAVLVWVLTCGLWGP